MTEILPGAIDQHITLVASSLSELETILWNAGIDLSQYGQGSAKTTEHLLAEILSGESELALDEKGDIIRKVTVANIDVVTTNPEGQRCYLVEVRQVFSDGRVRERQLGSSLGEKMQPGEDLASAVVRAVGEELGCTIDQSAVSLVGTTNNLQISMSYPGLLTSFTHHGAIVELPPEYYKPEGYVENQADKSTFFEWQPVS